MAAIDWFRWYHGTVNDPKWRVVARRSGQPLATVLAVWAAIVEHASENNPRGTIDGMDNEVVAAALDIEPDQVQAIREAMQGLTLDGNLLTGWERRQPKREDNSAERVRRYRDRKRAEQRSDTQGNAEVTQCNADETHGNDEKRLEKSREEKRDVTPSSLRSEGGAEAPLAERLPEHRPKAVPAGPPAAPPSRNGNGRPPAEASGEDPKQVLAMHRGEAVQIILDELWLSTRNKPPARFGAGWSLDRELSIWRDLVKRYEPEEVNGSMRVMRRVGGFGDLEPLSLLLFRSREPQCRDLWQRCLSFHRKQVEHEASKKAGVIRVEVVDDAG